MSLPYFDSEQFSEYGGEAGGQGVDMYLFQFDRKRLGALASRFLRREGCPCSEMLDVLVQ